MQKASEPAHPSAPLDDGDLADIVALARRLTGAARVLAAQPLVRVLDALESVLRAMAFYSAKCLAYEVEQLSAVIGGHDGTRHA